MQNGSPFSKPTHSQIRVNFQFIVKVDISQSVSTTPSSGWMPSLMWLAGPFTQRLTPFGVRNK